MVDCVKEGILLQRKFGTFRFASVLFALTSIVFTIVVVANPERTQGVAHYNQLFLGFFFLFWSFAEFKDTRKLIGSLFLSVAIFSFLAFVSIEALY